MGYSESPNEHLERSPHIEKVEMTYNVPYIEVFASGRIPLSCFNKKQVDISIRDGLTYIVPRYIFIADGEPCAEAQETFKNEKIADLDPSNPASYHIGVLGFEGWHYYDLKKQKAAK